MILVMQTLACGVLAMTFILLMALTYSFYKKSKIETGLNVSCSSGDSEVMTFNYNFVRGESEESKASKVFEAFQMIQDRRDENHRKWLEMKAKAIAENEAKDPETLKLRSVTEGEKTVTQ